MNGKQYGTKLAPEYDLAKITKVPIGLFCGKEDLISVPKDYLTLAEQLENTEVTLKEYDLGHYGLLLPDDTTVHLDIVKFIN